MMKRDNKQNRRRKGERKEGERERGRKETLRRKLVSSWILTSCSPHRIISGQLRRRRKRTKWTKREGKKKKKKKKKPHYVRDDTDISTNWLLLLLSQTVPGNT